MNQCQAEKLCNASAGWHLCTASEYRARGGQLGNRVINGAWIAACIRSGNAIHAPSNKICACLSGSNQKKEEVAWFCSSSFPLMMQSDSLYLGVSTSTSCMYIGAKTALGGGYWTVNRPVGLSDRALCCR